MKKREKVWLKVYITYMKSDTTLKSTSSAVHWANEALKEYKNTKR